MSLNQKVYQEVYVSLKKTLKNSAAFIVIFVAIFAGLFLITSCSIKVKEKQGPLGTEVNAADLQKALDFAVGDTSIVTAKKNQYVVYENNIRIEQNSIMRTKETRYTLIDVKDNPEQMTFVLFEDWWQYNMWSGTLIDEKHSELPALVYKKSTSLKSENFLSIKANEDNENLCDGEDITDDDGNVYDCIRYFNLVSQVRLVSPPEAVRVKPNCMNLPDCKMTIHFISYDQVKWRKGQIVKRVSVAVEFAQEVPDLMYEFSSDGRLSHTPPLLSFCVRGLMPLQGSQYYISQCQVLRDFE